MAGKCYNTVTMTNTGYYFWLIILILYILSPLDAHPFFFDDLIAFAILIYLWFRNSLRRAGRGNSCSGNRSQEHVNSSAGSLSFQDAYKLLGVDPGASLKEIKKAYKEKISKSHPDKVEHLSSF